MHHIGHPLEELTATLEEIGGRISVQPPPDRQRQPKIVDDRGPAVQRSSAQRNGQRAPQSIIHGLPRRCNDLRPQPFSEVQGIPLIGTGMTQPRRQRLTALDLSGALRFPTARNVIG